MHAKLLKKRIKSQPLEKREVYKCNFEQSAQFSQYVLGINANIADRQEFVLTHSTQQVFSQPVTHSSVHTASFEYDALLFGRIGKLSQFSAR